MANHFKFNFGYLSNLGSRVHLVLQQINLNSHRNFSYVIIAEVTTVVTLLELILIADKDIFGEEILPKWHTHAHTFFFLSQHVK